MLRHGLWEASARLSQRGILDWAQGLVLEESVLTSVQPTYPRLLLRRLGDAAPPVFWRSGSLPQMPALSVCGSRHPPGWAPKFAHLAGEAAAAHRYLLVSGGAIGCDTFGERGALGAGGSVVRLLPCGITRPLPQERVCELSLCPPEETFSVANAMERNFLIHAFSERSLTVHASLFKGGSWHGTKEALRRKLTTVCVPAQSEEPWRQALNALGAYSVSSPEQFATGEFSSHEGFGALMDLREAG